MTKKKRKKKIRFKGVLLLLLIGYIIAMIGYYIFTRPINNIMVKGNNLLTEEEIISAAEIDVTKSIFKINNFGLKKKIKTLELVNEVTIKKTILGNVTITIDEAKVLLFDTLSNNYVLSNGKEIDSTQVLGIPILVNYVPSEIMDKLLKGFSKLDEDIIHMISEVEYSPDYYEDTITDADRFLLRMNDGNKVYFNTVNITKLNKYQDIYKAVGSGGTLYLDSNSKNYIFKTGSEESEK